MSLLSGKEKCHRDECSELNSQDALFVEVRLDKVLQERFKGILITVALCAGSMLLIAYLVSTQTLYRPFLCKLDRPIAQTSLDFHGI